MDQEQYYEFECGCRCKQLSNTIKETDSLPHLKVDFYNLPNCNKTWELFENGLTIGIFQLESNLGQNWSKKTCPHNLDELGDLVSIIRPGTMENVYDGKNAAEHYADRKRRQEEAKPEYPALGEILADTYHVMIYQEQIIHIAKTLAGMSGKDATILMKAVGKKKFELMQKMRDIFIEGCQKTSGLSKEESTALFDGISASSRYLFNKSHGVGYAKLSYQTAYYKYHFPKHFIVANLKGCKNKPKPQEERQQIFSEAKKTNHTINPPRIDLINKGLGVVSFLYRNQIFLGLEDIKGVSDANLGKLIKAINNDGVDFKKFRWLDYLTYFESITNKTVFNNLILAGVIPVQSRKRSVFEHKIYKQTGDKAIEWMRVNKHRFESLETMLQTYLMVDKADGGPYNKNSVSKIEKSIESLTTEAYLFKDNPAWISSNERNLMGVTFSAHSTDETSIMSDTTCREMSDGKTEGVLVCQIIKIKEHTITKGKSIGEIMAFISLEDNSGQIDGILFPGHYSKYRNAAFKDNVVAARVKKSDRGGVIIEKLETV